MSKVILEFSEPEKMQRWLAYWRDGGGEDGMYEAWTDNEQDDYPVITVKEEHFE